LLDGDAHGMRATCEQAGVPVPVAAPQVLIRDCAYGFHVGCNTAIKLREAGFDAKYMNSGHSGWRAVGAPLKLLP